MKTAKKLVLNKETVRALQESELLRVAGGANPNGLAAAGHGGPAVLGAPGVLVLQLQAERVPVVPPCGSSITDGPPSTSYTIPVAGGAVVA